MVPKEQNMTRISPAAEGPADVNVSVFAGVGNQSSGLTANSRSASPVHRLRPHDMELRPHDLEMDANKDSS